MQLLARQPQHKRLLTPHSTYETAIILHFYSKKDMQYNILNNIYVFEIFMEILESIFIL